ncbi:MAG: polysaccharide biosynthesis tyrosine autokinase, partial [Anaerolineales bacterium]|nr:polysaccharide biosynthesis tyrosine autokinase [Anaerolineales bacterium]
MELRHYLSLVRKWLWLVIIGGLLGAGSAYLYSRMSTPIYQSTITLLISQGSGVTTDYYSMLTSQRAATTYIEQLKSPVILMQALKELGISMEEDNLFVGVSAQVVRDTSLLRVFVTDTDPARAQAIATQVAKVLNDQVNAAQMQRYRVVQDDLDRQVAEVRKKIDEVQKSLAPLGDATTGASAPEFVRTERARLQMELTTLQAQYSVLLQNANATRLAATRSSDAITVSSPATFSPFPISPRTTQNVLLGLAVGAMLAAGIAFLVEYLDDSLKSSDDVSRVLGLSTVGNVARFPKSTKNPLVVLDAPRAPYAESYRNLRTNLQFSLAVDAAAALVLSSAEPGEGKSTTIANLAIAMAQMGKRVILVDTDLRRPTLHHLFRVPPEPGLTDLFLKDQTLEHVIRETSQPGLHLLTCGKIPPNPAEVLASAWMDQLIDALKRQYDIVLFDSPP